MEERPTVNAPTGVLPKRDMNNSVFCDLFGMPDSMLRFYRDIHPDDTETTEKDIRLVTLENVLLNQQYNDLGFVVRDRLLILLEAQSTWSVNILVRVLLYAAQTLQQRIIDEKQNVYGTKRISLLKPEFYVIYTGDRGDIPDTLSLSDEFFGGEDSDLNVSVHVLRGESGNDIVSQYVRFTRVYREQVRLYGRKKEAVLETLRICRDRDILREYLASREKEVTDIMMTLFNQDTIMELWLYNEKKESREEGREEGIAEGIEKGILKNMWSLARDGLLDPSVAAGRLNMTLEEFEAAGKQLQN